MEIGIPFFVSLSRNDKIQSIFKNQLFYIFKYLILTSSKQQKIYIVFEIYYIFTLYLVKNEVY